jgi:CHAT domain-containing protein
MCAAFLVWLAGSSAGGHAETDGAGQALMNGIAAFRAANVARAIELWSKADAAAAAERDDAGRLEALLRRAEAYQLQGYLGRSAADLATCRLLVEPAGRVPPDATLEQLCQPLVIDRDDDGTWPILAGMLGRTCGSLGERDKASALLQQSLMLAEAQARWDLAAATRIDLGNLRMTEGDYAAAEVQFEQAFWRATVADDLAATAAINAARANTGAIRAIDAQGDERPQALRAEHLAAAAGWLSRAEERMPPSGQGALLSLPLAYAVALLEVHELTPAGSAERARANRLRLEEIAGTARAGLKASGASAARGPHWRNLSLALGYLGHLWELEGEREQALALTSEALLAAQQQEDELLLYRWYWQSGRLQRDMGRRDQAIADYQRAQVHLKGVRPDLLAAHGGFGGPFRQAVSPVYLEAAELLLERAKTRGQADLLAARDAVEQLKAAELEDYFQDDCVASLQAKVTGIDHLAPDTAALYPILIEDRLELLLSLRGTLRHRTERVSRAELQAAVAEFVTAVKGRRPKRFLAPARQLYDWLIAPFAGELDDAPEITTLIIVPDGPLRAAPIAALHDGERFLIERYAVAVTPGLRLLDPEPIPRDQVKLLLGGLSEEVELKSPIEGTKSHFDALPGVHDEIEGIRAIFGTAEPPLQDQDFQEARLGEELDRQPYTIVHLATHGTFDRDPDKSFLLTYDGQLTMDELEQFVKYSEFREAPVELLGLSACETAAGDERAALGLAGVGVKAGARSVLASLWQVEDQAAAELVTAFYERLQDPTISKAQALRAAQLEMAGNAARGHPGLWAPFVLIGNWL